MAADCALSEAECSAIIQSVDKLFEKDKFKEIYDLIIKFKNSKNVEILWRLALAALELGRASKSKSKVYEASAIIERALALDDSNPEVRKVLVNVMRYTGEYEGPKSQVQNAYVIKAHLELAKQLNPTDPAIHHSLGCWSYAFADIGKVARKMAGTTGVKPPKATYSEALEFFSKAEELRPSYSSMNLYMLGKTHHSMGSKSEAIACLAQARDFSPKMKQEDHDVHKKATKLLSKLNVKK